MPMITSAVVSSGKKAGSRGSASLVTRVVVPRTLSALPRS